jgi:Uma2 family endonuclease
LLITVGFAMLVQLDRRLFTVTDYQRMIETGILQEGDRCELLNGEIVKMATIGRKHAAVVNRINKLFSRILQEAIIVSVQNPIELGAFSQPEPDIALLRWQDDFYESGHPQAQDVYLLIEVADTTLESDRAIKLPIYAQTGISEVWIVNLQDLQVEVYRSPIEDTYSVSQILTAGQMLTISGLPDVAIEFNEILS